MPLRGGGVKELLCGLATTMGVLGWVSKVWRATDPVEGAKGVDHLFTTVTTVQRFNGGLVSYRELEDSKNALN